MSITRLPEIVYPLSQVNKVNEIVDVLNENLNMSYTEVKPLLTSVEGVCTWTITHNLGTENINCTIFEGDNLVISKVSVTSANVATVSLNSSTDIPAETYKIVIISNGANASSGSSITIDSTLSSTSTNPVENNSIARSIYYFPEDSAILAPNYRNLISLCEVTSGAKDINTSLILPKQIHSSVSAVTVNHFVAVLKSNKGIYFLSKAVDGDNAWRRYDLANVSTASVYNFSGNSIDFSFKFTNAFSSDDVDSNTPSIMEVNGYSITFS